MSGSMLEIEGRPGEGFVIRINPPQPELVPKEASEHVRAAGKEVLLAFRSFLDAAIADLEKPTEERRRGRGRRREKIEVE